MRPRFRLVLWQIHAGSLFLFITILPDRPSPAVVSRRRSLNEKHGHGRSLPRRRVGHGNYVPAANYELSVTVTGFKKFVQQNVQVVGVDTRRGVTLEVGSATEVITVQDLARLLKTESGEVSHRVTTDYANSLPVLPISGGSFFGATTMGSLRNPLAVSILLPRCLQL